MSHADVVQFLKDFADRDAVSVWRPGLDDWKPASHLFNIAAPTRLVSASEEVSSKRRYSLYGMYVGLSVVLCDYLFEWRGPQFKPWEGSGLGENIRYIVGTVATCLMLGFIIGGLYQSPKIVTRGQDFHSGAALIHCA
jgi:hypothetical protein